VSTNRSCKTAKDSRGAKIRVGDRVTAISLYDGSLMNTGTVIEMWRKGYDGTIIKLDVAPDPQYPHHWSHQASKTIKVARPLADKARHEAKSRKLTDKEWQLVFQLRCKSKQGSERALSKRERALVDRAFKEDEDKYGDMEIDVFNATVPFGSTVRRRRD
jgi:hypothetical protein